MFFSLWCFTIYNYFLTTIKIMFYRVKVYIKIMRKMKTLLFSGEIITTDTENFALQYMKLVIFASYGSNL